MNEIITGDARELAKDIPDNSIDLIFTDPPYAKEYIPLYGWLSKGRKILPQIMPGIVVSAAKAARPVTLSTPSGRMVR